MTPLFPTAVVRRELGVTVQGCSLPVWEPVPGLHAFLFFLWDLSKYPQGGNHHTHFQAFLEHFLFFVTSLAHGAEAEGSLSCQERASFALEWDFFQVLASVLPYGELAELFPFVWFCAGGPLPHPLEWCPHDSDGGVAHHAAW